MTARASKQSRRPSARASSAPPATPDAEGDAGPPDPGAAKKKKRPAAKRKARVAARRPAKKARAADAAAAAADADTQPPAATPAPAPRKPRRPRPARRASDAAASTSEAVADVHQSLDGLMDALERGGDDPEARRRAAEAMGYLASRLDPSPQGDGSDDLIGTARQLFSTDYYLRQWGRLGMRNRSEQVDDFGLDPTYEARVQPVLDVFFERYFRTRVIGAANIPVEGPAMMVCNHAGSLPWDGVMLKTALERELPEGRRLRWLTEDFAFHSPFLGAFINRIGAVRACQENAQRLLSQNQLLAVFPEGIKGIEKLYRQRYQLQRFGRGGHVKLALRAGVPVIPAAIVGAEEAYPLLYRVRAFSKAVGLPFIPVTPLFPLLGPLGMLPLPSRWVIVIGEPMQELAEHGPEAADDSSVVNDLNERIKSQVELLLARALEERGDHAYL